MSCGNTLRRSDPLEVRDQNVSKEGRMKYVTMELAVHDEPRPEVHGPQDVWEKLLKDRFDPLQERFYLIPLIGKEADIQELFVGGLSSSTVDTRTIIQHLLINYPNCNTFVVAHNHPGGNLQPSREDKSVTEAIDAVAKVMMMRLNDHIIFTNEGYFSFMKEGLL